MKRKSDLYLRDILEAISKVKKYTDSLDFMLFQNRDMVIDAVTHNLEIIGEIASQLPTEFKKKYNNVPWQDIKNFRNVVIHKYHKVDTETVWNIVQEELDSLKLQVEKILETE